MNWSWLARQWWIYHKGGRGRAAAEAPPRDDGPSTSRWPMLAACDIWQHREQSGTMLILNALDRHTFFLSISCAVCIQSGGNKLLAKKIRIWGGWWIDNPIPDILLCFHSCRQLYSHCCKEFELRPTSKLMWRFGKDRVRDVPRSRGRSLTTISTAATTIFLAATATIWDCRTFPWTQSPSMNL